MLWMLFFLAVIMAVGVLVVLYVAYPHRGQQMPYVPQLGESMKRAVDAVPTLERGHRTAARH